VLDSDTDIEFLRRKVRDFISERDWEQFHNPKDLAMSISIESSELMELFQWKTREEVEEIQDDPETVAELRRELADIIIYSISLANALDVDISEIVLEKLRENQRKYPVDKVKGSAKKYTEL